MISKIGWRFRDCRGCWPGLPTTAPVLNRSGTEANRGVGSHILHPDLIHPPFDTHNVTQGGRALGPCGRRGSARDRQHRFPPLEQERRSFIFSSGAYRQPHPLRRWEAGRSVKERMGSAASRAHASRPDQPTTSADAVTAFAPAPASCVVEDPPSPRPVAEAFDAAAATRVPASPVAQEGMSPRSPEQPAQSSSNRSRRRRKPLPPAIALRGYRDGGSGRREQPTSLRTLMQEVMDMTLRGKHRRPATNPTPTTRHEVLLNSSGDGLGTPFQEEENGNQQMGLAATVAGTTDIAVGVGGGRRRPRPLAISAAEAYQYNVSTILPGRLLIGGEDAGGSEATLRRLGVRGVVNATRDGKEEEEDREGSGGVATPASSWAYVKLGWKDEVGQAILSDLDRAFACIEEARRRGGPCLVYCKKGMSRSGAVVIAYLMKAQDMSLWEALTYARDRRAIIAPNVGFMAQLVELEVSIRGTASVDTDAYENDRFGTTCAIPVVAGGA